jgi:RHS repeat-associated protein
MNTSMRIRQIMILGIFALLAGTAAAAQPAGERYIVILKSRSGPAPDVVRLGGTIDFRQEDQLNVTMPREAVAALRADPLVRYIQALAGASDAALIGEPEEPTPGAPRRLVPHATAGNQSWSRSYRYDDAGNITNIGSQQFVYDELGRLKEMATSGNMTEQYGYDRYGNQTSRNSGGVMQTIATEPATNRLSTGYAYDSAGNVISGDGYTLSYDALGQAAAKTYTDTTTATTFNETYIYTASEERIGVQTSNSRETSSWLYWSVRDEGGKVLRQYRSSALDPTQTALWIEDYVYRDGLLVGAERPPTLGGRRHFHLDHLGSPRLITSNDGQIVSMHDYLPFGGESTSVWQETGAGFDREDPMKFTGHERDYAGSFGREDWHAIDYMHARYYSAAAGRFLSVDPLDGDPRDPQSWNRYAYVRNNPIDRTDPDGREDKKWNVQQIINEAGEYVEGIENGYVSSVAFEIGHHAPTSGANALGQAVGSTMALVQSVDEAGTGAAVAAAGGMVTVLSGGSASPVSVPAVAVGGVAVVHGTISAGVSIVNIASAMSGIKQRKEGTLGEFKGTDAKGRENKQVHDAMRKAGHGNDPAKRREIHDTLQGQSKKTFQELVRFIKDYFGG